MIGQHWSASIQYSSIRIPSCSLSVFAEAATLNMKTPAVKESNMFRIPKKSCLVNARNWTMPLKRHWIAQYFLCISLLCCKSLDLMRISKFWGRGPRKPCAMAQTSRPTMLIPQPCSSANPTGETKEKKTASLCHFHTKICLWSHHGVWLLCADFCLHWWRMLFPRKKPSLISDTFPITFDHVPSQMQDARSTSSFNRWGSFLGVAKLQAMIENFIRLTA